MKRYFFIIGLLTITLTSWGQIQKSDLQTHILKSDISGSLLGPDQEPVGKIGVTTNNGDTIIWFYSQGTNNRFADAMVLSWKSKEQMLKDWKSVIDNYKELSSGTYYKFNDIENSEFKLVKYGKGSYAAQWSKLVLYDRYNSAIYTSIYYPRVKKIVEFLENGEKPVVKKYKHFERR